MSSQIVLRDVERGADSCTPLLLAVIPWPQDGVLFEAIFFGCENSCSFFLAL